MLKLIAWLDTNALLIFASVLIVLIPLYPKWPLVEVIPGYIVRVRLEDFLIATSVVWWLILVMRKKVNINDNGLVKPVVIYLTVGFLSVLSALYITRSVPLNQPHVLKIILHFFRRIEYFSLFFIFFSSVRTVRQARFLVSLMFLTLIGVIIYGYGQKYLYWPAFSTMNREFSKGWWLYLTKHARVLSTFGGHYDLAAYLVMTLSFCLSFFFGMRRKLGKIVIGLVLAGSFWLLILTASRTSFLAYLLGASVVVFLYGRGQHWLRTAVQLVAVLALSILVMLSFGDLSERFTKLIKVDQIKSQFAWLTQPAVKPPEQKAIFLENNLEAVTSKTDEPPTPIKPKGANVFNSGEKESETAIPSTPKERPVDVYEDIPLQLPATLSAQATPGAAIQKRTYSKIALQYDLSTGIRFDTLWPRAIKGFLRNPILGTGYSTLTKESDDVFTEAESTDNDYLRALGETGILGLLSFGAILWFLLLNGWKVVRRTKSLFTRSLTVGFMAGLLGLLLNAVYIDIFEASKVAMSFWAVAGITTKVWRFKKLW